ncbi:MAG: D-2-hydroxyacid dehydrogenase [Dehalococcoidia bacterium]
MPPQTDPQKAWAARISDTLPDFDVVLPLNADEAKKEIVDADAAFGNVPADALSEAGQLRWLQSPQAAPPPGYYYDELIGHPVTVTNFRGIYNDHISAHIMMYVLALSRGLPGYMRAKTRHEYDKDANDAPFVFLPDSTAVIVGVGGIGGDTALHCKGFGMHVIAVDPRVGDPPAGVDELFHTDKLADVIGRADFVLVTMPHTPENKGLFNAEMFERMKSTAYFVNIGRGPTTKLDDLAAAIENGVIRGAGLDVYETEPLDPDHRLWDLDNVILTPHVAAKEDEGGANLNQRRSDLLLENARRFASGDELLNVVDKSLWF